MVAIICFFKVDDFRLSLHLDYRSFTSLLANMIKRTQNMIRYDQHQSDMRFKSCDRLWAVSLWLIWWLWILFVISQCINLFVCAEISYNQHQSDTRFKTDHMLWSVMSRFGYFLMYKSVCVCAPWGLEMFKTFVMHKLLNGFQINAYNQD